MMREAINSAEYSNSLKLIQFFCMILNWCDPVNPVAIFETFRDNLCADDLYAYQREKQNYHLQINTEVEDRVLTKMNNYFKDNGYDNDITKFGFRMPRQRDGINQNIGHRSLIQEQFDEYPRNEQEEALDAYLSEDSQTKLNDEQKKLFDLIKKSVDANEWDDEEKQYTIKDPDIPNFFFIQAAGGTGKTHLCKALLHYIRSKGPALPCASSGIAANLLPGGRTSHYLFKIPVKYEVLEKRKSCNIEYESSEADLLRSALCFFWDEAGMSPKTHAEAVDNTLRDLTKTDRIFGGKLMIMSGDFKQLQNGFQKYHE